MSRGTMDLEERTMRILAEAAKGPLPDAGIAALLTKVVRDAYRRGGKTRPLRSPTPTSCTSWTMTTWTASGMH